MRTCDMPTDSLRMCSRPARFAYLAKDGTVVRAYCAQHFRASGRSAILRPRPWEYTRVRDLAAGMHLASMEGTEP